MGRRLANIPPAALAVPLTLLWLAPTGCTGPAEDGTGSARSNQAIEFELPPFDDAERVLAEMARLDQSPVQRQAIEDLQAAMRQIDIRQHSVYHWPMIVLRVSGPAELRASPSSQAPEVADLKVGSHVVTFHPFTTWVEVEIIDFPAHHSLLHREPGPPINWRGAGFVHRDRLEFDEAAQARFNSEVFLSARAAFQETFASADSSQCLADLQVCTPRGAEFDCELIMIVCFGETFMGNLG